MNHIVIIGNGFDLAHGLKTSYKDFFMWYLNKIESKVIENNRYSDNIITVSPPVYADSFGGTQESLKANLSIGSLTKNNKLMENLKQYRYSVTFPSRFMNELFSNVADSKWVDIESFYFSVLKRIFTAAMSDQKTSREVAIDLLQKWNSAFEELKRNLEHYLTEQKPLDKSGTISDIHDHFREIKGLINPRKGKLIIINFNYTDSVECYFDENDFSSNVKIINVHGSLNDVENPIIFGYGDETDKYYHEMESLNNNEFLKYMKSFGYSTNTNYQKMSSLIEDSMFNLHIMGHSCGISDRVLLKSIVEFGNCDKIYLYYHQIDDKRDDYLEKNMNISRHFSMENKNKMRIKVASKEDSKPLVSFNKKQS